MLKKTDSLIIGYDYTHGRDNTVLVVGKKILNGGVEIINAFQGKEAEDLWNKLTTKASKE